MKKFLTEEKIIDIVKQAKKQANSEIVETEYKEYYESNILEAISAIIYRQDLIIRDRDVLIGHSNLEVTYEKPYPSRKRIKKGFKTNIILEELHTRNLIRQGYSIKEINILCKRMRSFFLNNEDFLRARKELKDQWDEKLTSCMGCEEAEDYQHQILED